MPGMGMGCEDVGTGDVAERVHTGDAEASVATPGSRWRCTRVGAGPEAARVEAPGARCPDFSLRLLPQPAAPRCGSLI